MKKQLKLLAILSLMTALTFGQNASEASILTEGKSSISITPDMVAFGIALQVLDLNRRISIEKAFGIIDNVKSSMMAIGVDEEKLKTNRFNVVKVEEYNRETNQREFKGYRTEVELTIRLQYSDKKIDKIFEIFIDEFDDDFNMRFELSDELMERSKEKLIQLAIEDSRIKAGIISKSTDVKLGKLLKAQYGDPNVISGFGQLAPELDLRGILNSTMASSVNLLETLTPQEIEIKTTIAIEWEIIR